MPFMLCHDFPSPGRIISNVVFLNKAFPFFLLTFPSSFQFAFKKPFLLKVHISTKKTEQSNNSLYTICSGQQY